MWTKQKLPVGCDVHFWADLEENRLLSERLITYLQWLSIHKWEANGKTGYIWGGSLSQWQELWERGESWRTWGSSRLTCCWWRQTTGNRFTYAVSWEWTLFQVEISFADLYLARGSYDAWPVPSRRLWRNVIRCVGRNIWGSDLWPAVWILPGYPDVTFMTTAKFCKVMR